MRLIRGARDPRDGGLAKCECGTLLTYEKRDVETADHGERAFVRCPSCGRQIDREARTARLRGQIEDENATPQ